jgi:hypothetical protein
MSLEQNAKSPALEWRSLSYFLVLIQTRMLAPAAVVFPLLKGMRKLS